METCVINSEVRPLTKANRTSYHDKHAFVDGFGHSDSTRQAGQEAATYRKWENSQSGTFEGQDILEFRTGPEWMLDLERCSGQVRIWENSDKQKHRSIFNHCSSTILRSVRGNDSGRDVCLPSLRCPFLLQSETSLDWNKSTEYFRQGFKRKNSQRRQERSASSPRKACARRQKRSQIASRTNAPWSRSFSCQIGRRQDSRNTITLDNQPIQPAINCQSVFGDTRLHKSHFAGQDLAACHLTVNSKLHL